MTRRRRVLGITGWLFLGAVFGPLLFGAASTLFWVRAADGNTAVRVAWRTYDRVNPPAVGLAVAERPAEVSFGPSCEEHYQARLLAGDFGTIELEGAIRRYSEGRLHTLLKIEPAYEALLSLPHPVLGALDGCIGGSPLLWAACQSYARRVIDDGQAERAKKRPQIAALVRRETEAIWCAAAGARQLKVRTGSNSGL